jgi:ankyrin repeat protein
VKLGAPIAGRSRFFATKFPALSWAAHYGHINIAKLLISAGANIDDDVHGTALDCAVQMERAAMVEYLVESGARTSNAYSKAALAIFDAMGGGVTPIQLDRFHRALASRNSF